MSQEINIKCHSQVLLSQSAYFAGLFDFKQLKTDSLNQGGTLTHTVHDYPVELFQVMLDYFYLGQATVNSDHLVSLLSLCLEYILPNLKLAIETIFAMNLDVENFLDTYLIAKAYECNLLKQKVIDFGRENLQKLK